MNGQEGGFECEFVEKPPQAVQSECPMCLLVLREPYQVECCGYAFCKECIRAVRLHSIPCPCCNAETFGMFQDKRLKLSLDAFRVHCTNKEQGCQWEGELGQLDNHLNYKPPEEKQLEGCQFSKIKCFYCSELFLRSKIQVHQRDQCQRRPFSCEYCKDYDSNYEDVTTNHWPVCDHYLIPCPNKCGFNFQHQTFESHIATECPLTIVDCDFQHVGCEVRLLRKDMPAHLVKSLVIHLSLQAASYKRDMKRLDDENKQLKHQIAKLTRDLQMQKICTPICPVEITMTNFEQKRISNNSWCSAPFYTYTKGYKMYLNVQANGGVRSGKGTYVSVKVALMKGEFDDELEWSFQGKINVQLLKQERDSGGRYGRTIDFSGSTSVGEAGQRVIDGDVSKIRHGFSDFISHSQLRAKYLNNDCITFYIKYK